MATSTSTISPVRKSLRLRRLVAGSLIAVLVALFGLAAWCYSVARSALPQLDGSLRVAGLTALVTVIRDGHGVPTIEAANLDDLFFAQGYVIAQDRLWQQARRRSRSNKGPLDVEEIVPQIALPVAQAHARLHQAFEHADVIRGPDILFWPQEHGANDAVTLP